MAETIFARAGRGYDRAQVDAFLLEQNRKAAEKEAAWEARQKELETALKETQDALKKSEAGLTDREERLRAELEAKERQCEGLQASIGQRMIAADTRAEEIVAGANREAEELLTNANREAEEILSNANREAEELLANANREAEELLANANRTAEELVANANREAEELSANANREAEELVASQRSHAEQETARIIEETGTRCASIGQSADVLSARINGISAEMHRLECDLRSAMEELRRKELGDAE